MIATNTSAKTVTSEQIDAAWRIIGDDGKVFYRVASATDFDLTYTVRSIKVDGKRYLTCTCKAGQNGRAECWHRRAALAERDARSQRNAKEDERQAKVNRLVAHGLTNEQAELAANNHESITDDELVRVYGAKAKKSTGKGRTDLKTFSLMR